jgi:hypothetical protein
MTGLEQLAWTASFRTCCYDFTRARVSEGLRGCQIATLTRLRADRGDQNHGRSRRPAQVSLSAATKALPRLISGTVRHLGPKQRPRGARPAGLRELLDDLLFFDVAIKY